MNFKKPFCLVFLFFVTSIVCAQLKLPAIFSDHMVLQQQTKVPIWGWAKPGETVYVSTNWSKEKANVVTGQDGIWKTDISTTKAGGPYTLKIKSSDKTITIQDVLLGVTPL